MVVPLYNLFLLALYHLALQAEKSYWQFTGWRAVWWVGEYWGREGWPIYVATRWRRNLSQSCWRTVCFLANHQRCWFSVCVGSFLFHFCYCDTNYRKWGDLQTHKNRIQECINSWQKQLPQLVDAYLAWKHKKADSLPQNATSAPVKLMGNDPATSTHHQDSTWQIIVIDFHCESIYRQINNKFLTSTWQNIHHIHFYMYLGWTTPMKPLSIMNSLVLLPKCLSLLSCSSCLIYIVSYTVCPCFTLDALSRTLSHLHCVRIYPLLFCDSFHLLFLFN